MIIPKHIAYSPTCLTVETENNVPDSLHLYAESQYAIVKSLTVNMYAESQYASCTGCTRLS